MTREQINKLLSEGLFPGTTYERELIETHISWVIICDQFVYKIKKPIQYSFLDFSTIELRKHFCEREIELNKRLTENIYIDVQTIFERGDHFVIGGGRGKVLDFAVRMNKIDREKQMDVLLQKDQVTGTDIQNLAKKIAHFHQNIRIIDDKDLMDIKEKFRDLKAEKVYLEENLGIECGRIIDNAIQTSDIFMMSNKALLAERLKYGFVRDCHGDLHSRNIFLLPDPQPFDCVEFNDDFRQIDVLNEVAFLCMDLDSFGRADLSSRFIDEYNEVFPAMKTEQDRLLFTYFKSYRANVRAKVNSLRAKTARNGNEKSKVLNEAGKYLSLMNNYLTAVHHLA